MGKGSAGATTGLTMPQRDFINDLIIQESDRTGANVSDQERGAVLSSVQDAIARGRYNSTTRGTFGTETFDGSTEQIRQIIRQELP